MSALTGHARICRGRRGPSDSELHRLERGETEGREGAGWEERRGRWNRREEDEEETAAAAGPTG